MDSMLLQQLSDESDALIAVLVPHVLTVEPDRARPRAANARRPPYVVTAAETTGGAERPDCAGA